MVKPVTIFTKDLPDDLSVLPTGIIGVDIETTTKEPTDWANPRKGQVASVQIYSSGLQEGYILTAIENPKNLEQYLNQENVYPLFHHYMYDAEWLWACFNIAPRLFGDTKLLAKLLREPSTSLLPLLKRYITEDPESLPDKTQQKAPWHVPFYRWTEDMKKYAIDDVRHLQGLHTIMYTRLSREDRLLYHDMLTALPSLVKLYGRAVGRGILSLGDLDFAVTHDGKRP